MKHMGKRIGCAALAAQMLLTPAAQAAEPLRETLEQGLHTALVSHAASRLENPERTQETTFPRLRKLAGSSQAAAQSTGTEKRLNVASPDLLLAYIENDDELLDTSEEPEIKGSEIEVPETDGSEIETPEIEVPETDELETDTPATPESSDAASAGVLPAGEAEDALPVDFEPEKEGSMNSLVPKDESGISAYSVLGGYRNVYTLLAIFGFGPDYRVPKDPGLNPQYYDEGRDYKYNIENPEGKEWYEYRDAELGDPYGDDPDFEKYGTENERYAFWDNDAWRLKPSGCSEYNFAYLYGQTFDVTGGVSLTGDENFRWDDAEEKQYFTGHLPGSADGIVLPRLPNKEFTNEWYVLGSQMRTDVVGTSYNQITVDGINSYNNFCDFFVAEDDEGKPLNYQNLTYNERRDFYRFKAGEELNLFDSILYNNPNTPQKSPYTEGDYANFTATIDALYRKDPPFNPLRTTLPLIGRWKDSTNATLTELTLAQKLEGSAASEDAVIYPLNDDQSLSELQNMTYLQLKAADKGFDADTGKYFLRLPAQATELDVKNLLSYEPGSTVTLSAQYEGITDAVEYSLAGEDTRTYGAYGEPTNSREDPARKKWTLDKETISVVKTEDKKKHELTKLTFHVVPPAGESKSKDYVIEVQHLQQPKMEQNAGNTPMGMIERNDSNYDSTWTDAKKTATRENLTQRYSFVLPNGTKLHPADSVNNNEGYLWMDTYSPDAWAGAVTDKTKNVDLDASAIVVYPNSQFTVPGFSVYDSLGVPSEGATEIDDPDGTGTIKNVKWKLELTTVDKLSPSLMTDVITGGATKTFGGDIDDTSVDKGSITIDLTDYNVKPGVYKLSYTYTDEYDGAEHTGGSFDRTVVVTPVHGDVDLDGSVTPADGIALRALVGNDALAFYNQSLSNSTGRLYYYRVCDVDGSGLVDSTDVAQLLQGYSPKLRDTTRQDSGYFYLPLPGGKDRQATKPITKPIGDAPAISLKYLGAGVDVTDGGRVDYDPTPSNPSVFWMDLQLSNSATLDAIKGNLTSFTATLTYNSDYVAPYIPEGYATWGDYVLSLNDQWQGWELQLIYEWVNEEDVLISKPVETDITPVNTPSKATSLLEGWSSESALREVRFSVTPTTASVSKNPLADGSVLKLPFKLTSFPTGMSQKDYKLVELALGPRDFLVTTEKADGTTGTALWDNNPITNVQTTNNVNLKGKLDFAGSDDVKLGKDATPAYYVYVSDSDYATDVASTADGKNLVYGRGQNVQMNNYGVPQGEEDIPENRSYFSGLGEEIVWSDPASKPGDVVYNSTSHTLTVTPTKAGTFDFMINKIPYRIVVDKSPLTLTVDNVKKYYGETASTATTFSYDTTQILALDSGKGANTGTESDLKTLIGGGSYTRPSIRLMTAAEGGRAIGPNDVPGDYTVVIEGGLSDNYIFNYVRADKPAADKDHISSKLGTATLTILPRPLLVDQVTKNPVGSLAENSIQYGVVGTATTEEFSRASVDSKPELTKYDSATKTIDGIPITPTIIVVSGDKLELSYEGLVQKNADDPNSGFKISGEKEDRDVKIGEIALTENEETQNDRYVLKNATEIDVVDGSTKILPLNEKATASIEKRKMLKMRVLQAPARLNYTYGQTLDLSRLMVEAAFSDRPNYLIQAGNSLENLESMLGVEGVWVDHEDDVPADDAETVVDGEQLHVADRDGKYLCLRDTGTKEVRVYIGPFRVSKQTLTLTLRTETRYYGESIENWTVGYNHGQLAEWDRSAHPQVSGTIDDLDWMTGFDKTDITVRPSEQALTNATLVAETTDVGEYFAVIFGGSADDYEFEFARTGRTGAEGNSKEFGYAPLNVERRPILITRITSNAGAMYHDTRSYIIDPAKAVAGGDAAGFQAVKPTQGTTYYESDSTPYTWDGRWPLTRSAVHRSDTLNAAYRGEFLERDNEQMPFYELSSDENVRIVPVQVTGLHLTGEGSGNYRLLFASEEIAAHGWAGDSETASRTEGTVYKRKIAKIELTGPNKVSYQYGELLDLTGLTAKITYASENGEPAVVETVAYENITLNGVDTTTFKRLGLTLHMGRVNGAEVFDQQQLSVAEHNGKFLYVTGPQYTGGGVVNSRAPRPLSIQKKELNLTVADITRKYGEENGVYTYEFEPADLASWDRELLGSMDPSGSAEALGAASVSAALAAVNAPYEDGSDANRLVTPHFRTVATKTSPVNKGQPYALDLLGGSMANYEFLMHSGEITIERRPIRVDGIRKNPIYTLAQNEFTLMTQRPRFENVVCTQEELDLTISNSDGVSGEPVVAGDNISLRIVEGVVDGTNSGTATSPVHDSAFGTDEYEIRRNAIIVQIELLQDGDNENYILTNAVRSDGQLMSQITAPNQAIVHRRQILSIRVALTPQKMEYTYGEPLDLRGMTLEITYKKGADGTEIANVDPTVMRDVFINYWDPTQPTPTGAELTADDSILQIHPASTGDHLTIAVDEDGFAHNEKYLMVSARPLVGQPYVDSVLTDVPIVVKPRELTYTLTAEDKRYDHSRDAVGAITLTNVYGDDEVWVKNGTDYTGSLPAEHTFGSGDYYADGYDGMKFAFTDENVSYRLSDGHDIFLDLQDIPVEVTGLALDGWDKENYHINAEVLTDTEQMAGRDGVPSARILPIDRPAPAVDTTLWVDEHTNTVKVLTGQEPETFGDDLDSRNTLHYEYALIYEDELGGIVITDYQDDPYFGGEPVTVDEVEYVPGEDPITPAKGAGQTLDPEDTLFGTREALPRGTWIGALVRIAGTNNYNASAGQTSYDPALQVEEESNNDAQLLAALESAARTAAARPLPVPAEETDRQVERLEGPVIKTYDYRLDLIATTLVENQDKTTLVLPSLEAVWFTDITSFAEEEDLDRLVGNEPKRYYSYSWNPQRSVRIEYPIELNKDILVELPVEGGASNERVETLVNPDGTAKIYLSLSAPYNGGGGGGAGEPRHLEIVPGELTLEKPGAKAQLRVRVSPANLIEKGVTWTSSDENVVIVSSNGLVTAVGPGTATITAATRKGNVSDSITVVVLGQAAPTTKVPYADTMFNSAFDGAFFDLPSSKLFEPERVMTRRELAEVMNRFFQTVEGRVPGEVSEYVDLGDADPRNSAIRNLDKWGIVTGVEENVFAPDQIVTRAEMSVILCRMLMIPAKTDPNAPHAFTDAVPGVHWAWGYIDALAEAEITNGTGDGKYSPERPMTRAELSAFLCRSLITIVDRTKGPVVVPIDVPETHWAYAYILRAVNGAPAVRLIDKYLPKAEENTEKK